MIKFKGSKYKDIYDRLKLERIAEDGNKFYQGEKGKYLFLFSNGGLDKGRIGKVLLNRAFLTGLFKPKHSESFKTWTGDDKDKFLVFQETASNEITVYAIPKKKKV